MRSPRGTSWQRVAAVAVPLLLAVVLGFAIVADQRTRARTSADAQVRADVATAVTKVRTDLRNQLSAAGAGSQSKQRIVAADAAESAGLSADIATQARDGGTPVLDDIEHTPSAVAPIYRSGADTSSTEQRRAAIVAYRIVPLDFTTTLTSLVESTGGLAVHGPHQLVDAVPSGAPPGARTFGVDMDLTGFPGWTVQAWLPAPGTPGIAWLLVLGEALLLALVAALLVLLIRRTERAEARRDVLERNSSLVTGLAPVLQGSLDLGEVVPAVSSQLVDGLGLAGLSLSRSGEGGERQVFGWGTAPDPATPATPAPTAGIDAGGTFAITLARGGRRLGTLRVVAGRRLRHDDLVGLTTASELIGSTLANAEAFAQQQNLVDRMRSVDELKTVFLATASHELRTPVTAIVGFSTLLLESWDTMNTAQGRGLMERVMSNGRRLETLISQLLDFAQLERGLPRSSDEVLDLGRTVARIVNEQPELAARHELRSNYASGCVVRGSAAAVERIVTNLVGNAAKYSPNDTAITVSVRQDGERVLLLVDDEGPGVPEEDRDRIFSRFYRGRGDSVVRTSGAGIGLAIVAEYAASLSGEASVAQSPGGGARFCVSFPAVRVLASTVRGDTSNTVIGS